MLFVHEVHQVAGGQAEVFEALYRDGCGPVVGPSAGARLLWFLTQAHGTGPAYTYVTITGVESLAALDDLSARLRRGDLRTWVAALDSLRHDAVAKVLEPVPWSPPLDVDAELGAPSGSEANGHGADRGPDLPLFMEDTAWPYRGRFDDYLERAGTLYLDTLARAAAQGRNILELVAAFTSVYGTGRHREVVLWQRVARPDLLAPLLTREVPPEHRAPGTWMHDALEVRDRWESRLLRVAPWSPLR